MESDVRANKLSEIISQAVKDKVFPGSVVGFIEKNRSTIITSGSYSYDKNKPLKKDSIFDVASITKTVPTAMLALKLIEEKKLSLGDPVDKYLPQFVGKWKSDVKVSHLLTQTVDYGFSLSSLKDNSAELILAKIYDSDLKSPPGKNYSYTNSSSIILGKIIEVVADTSLDQLAHQKLFNPLLMRDTTFKLPKKNLERVVPTEIDPWRKEEIRGVVHDESAYVLSKKKYVGSAGLFSTVPDMLNILAMIFDGGMFNGKRILDNSTINLMSRNHLEGIGEFSGLGWELNNPQIDPKKRNNMISKTGFTGCFICCDIEKKIGFVMFSNYHYPARKKDFKSLNKVRRACVDIVFENE